MTAHAPVHYSERAGVRLLHIGPARQDALVQGAMSLSQPSEIYLEFAQRMMAWTMFYKPASLAKRHVMQMGLGAASLTRFCHQQLRMRTTAVEINPHVVQACRDWFGLPPDDHLLKVITADAGLEIQRPRWLNSVDVLQVDAYDLDAARPVLDSVGFYQHCARALTPDGCLVTNLFSADASYATSLQHLQAVFGMDSLWVFKPTKEGNTIVLAQKKPRPLPLQERIERCEHIQLKYRLDTQPWLYFFNPLH